VTLSAAAPPARTTYSPSLQTFRVEAYLAHLPLVAVDDGDVIAAMQLSMLPGLARRAALGARLEAGRVRADYRPPRLGAALLVWAVTEARRRGCAPVPLTTEGLRADAHRFDERLGFAASHKGLTLHCCPPQRSTAETCGGHSAAHYDAGWPSAASS